VKILPQPILLRSCFFIIILSHLYGGSIADAGELKAGVIKAPPKAGLFFCP
jgi:hypothetical protein